MDVKSYIKSFGLKIFLVKAIRKPFYNNYSAFGKKLSLYNEKVIKNFLYKNVIQNLKNIKSQSVQPVNKDVKENTVIWTMWWQGYKNAPDIVKKCIDRIKSENKHNKVVIIDSQNYKDYVKINPQILNLVTENKITITQLSDIIRANLLFNYGGVWIDSTVYELKPLPERIFSMPFYTIKTGKYTNDPSHGRWTGFFMSAPKGSELMGFMKECFNIYYDKYDILIDYILVDYLINLAYDVNAEIKREIKLVPQNNEDVFKLALFLNKDVSKAQILSRSNTYLYKLTYKMNFIDDPNTLYNQIISGRKIK